MNAEITALQRIKDRARAGWRRVPKADAELACCDIFDIASEALAARPAAPPVVPSSLTEAAAANALTVHALSHAAPPVGEAERQGVIAQFIDPAAVIYLPDDVRSELFRCAASNGRISAEYLVAIYRCGVANGKLAAEIAKDAALASPAPQPAKDDGSVMVRIDRVYVDAMRGDGLTGPFACVRLVEYEGEPRLELTTAPVPTPDTAEWWREVAQGLGVEIAKLKALVSAPACVASTPQGDVCGLCGRASADHRGPENAAAPAPVEPPPADMATVYGKRFDAIKSADERLEAMRGKMPDAEIDVYKAVLAADARRKAQE